MKGVDSLIVIAAIAIFMAGVVVGMVLMALAKHCCLRCEYYDLCRSEVKRGKERKNEKF